MPIKISDSVQTALASRLIPTSSSDPTWFFFVIIIAALVGILGWKWLDGKQKSTQPPLQPRQSQQSKEPPTQQERRAMPGESQSCLAHSDRIERLEGHLVEIREATSKQSLDVQKALFGHFKDMMDEVRKELDWREAKQMVMFDQKLTAFQEKAMTALIQACRAIALQAVSDRIDKKSKDEED